MTASKDQYLKDVWKKILDYLRINTSIEPTVISTFYEPSSIYELTTEKATVLTPNIICKQIIQQEIKTLSAAFTDVLQADRDYIVEVCQKSELRTAVKPSVQLSEDEAAAFASMPLQRDRTFDNFVVGDCNRESHAAALACATRPGQFFNPLFIFGNSGLGKTHLLMAIGNYIQKNDPSKKVYYTESLKFVENVVKAIKIGKIDQFKEYLYGIDVFLVDDIQFLAGKEKSHEIFFTIYNELINNHKQICIASDRQPNEIKGLEDRLISRFSSGLSVGIDSPEFETSLAILEMKIKQSGQSIEVDPDGLAYIASNFSGNIRSLEGALNRVLFYAIQFQPDGSSIRLETVMNALKAQAVVSDQTGLSPKKIIDTVADYYGLTHQQIVSKTRTKNIANARHISIYLCRTKLSLSYIKIGEEFGGRDHATIMSACRKVEKALKTDPAMKEAVNTLEKRLDA
ncbi:MAG: chromosomal replication initiator protein DnaA [Solobacterium sp.]|jgi:chromosomal replication initiator protein|nr:chromosomal replication initiator protein DnaA [Solobacterium sp.]MCH4048995.1 chromosomal replication initiator protein DnaA [Solobacterium sp.]MCH4074251.1 chromosomal replication initiator protein DnaA [Solobacterium sp.]MCI1313552.1 chromosomal replication initiator protein DnaA [Solobacterium sp.]MCI1345740.1 chromosomal replication initiator protein DnaA [Solobacterium sp.]